MHLAPLDSFRLHAACGWDPRPYILDLWVRSLVRSWIRSMGRILHQILDLINGEGSMDWSNPLVAPRHRGTFYVMQSSGYAVPLCSVLSFSHSVLSVSCRSASQCSASLRASSWSSSTEDSSWRSWNWVLSPLIACDFLSSSTLTFCRILRNSS